MKGTQAGAVTLRHVAAEAGVSTATVSRVITGADPVAPEKEKRVREAMRVLGYEPNRLARGLRRQETRTIGLVLPSFTNVFFFELIAQTVEVGKEAGYSVLVAGDANPEAEALKLARGNLVDGLIFVAAHSEQASTQLADIDVPIVCFDRAPAGLDCPVVHVDNERGAAEVTELLIAGGATRIAHLEGPAEVLASAPRRRGFEQALAARGLDCDPQLLRQGDYSDDSGYALMRELLALDERPDAVFAANDLMAIGAMRAASEAGLAVPDDIAVAGFDGISSGRFTVPRLATCAQPIQEMANLAVARLLDLIHSGEVASRREDIVVEGTLLARESAGQR